jgi:hypothetical protein
VEEGEEEEEKEEEKDEDGMDVDVCGELPSNQSQLFELQQLEEDYVVLQGGVVVSSPSNITHVVGGDEEGEDGGDYLQFHSNVGDGDGSTSSDGFDGVSFSPENMQVEDGDGDGGGGGGGGGSNPGRTYGSGTIVVEEAYDQIDVTSSSGPSSRDKGSVTLGIYFGPPLKKPKSDGDAATKKETNKDGGLGIWLQGRGALSFSNSVRTSSLSDSRHREARRFVASFSRLLFPSCKSLDSENKKVLSFIAQYGDGSLPSSLYTTFKCLAPSEEYTDGLSGSVVSVVSLDYVARECRNHHCLALYRMDVTVLAFPAYAKCVHHYYRDLDSMVRNLHNKQLQRMLQKHSASSLYCFYTEDWVWSTHLNRYVVVTHVSQHATVGMTGGQPPNKKVSNETLQSR